MSDAKTSPSAQTQVEERRTAVVLHAVHWETREPKQESQRGWQSSQRPVAELRNWAVAHAQVPVEVRMAPCLQDVHFAEESQARQEEGQVMQAPAEDWTKPGRQAHLPAERRVLGCEQDRQLLAVEAEQVLQEGWQASHLRDERLK